MAWTIERAAKRSILVGQRVQTLTSNGIVRSCARWLLSVLVWLRQGQLAPSLTENVTRLTKVFISRLIVIFPVVVALSHIRQTPK
jgi:hypothetical protein